MLEDNLKEDLERLLKSLGTEVWPVICKVFGHDWYYDYNDNGPEGYTSCNRCDIDQHAFYSTTGISKEYKDRPVYYEECGGRDCWCRGTRQLIASDDKKAKSKESTDNYNAKRKKLISSMTPQQKAEFDELYAPDKIARIIRE